MVQKNKYTIADKTLINIGCGNARDTKYFKTKNIKVTGIDQSSIAIKLNKEYKLPKNIFLVNNKKKLKDKLLNIYETIKND